MHAVSNLGTVSTPAFYIYTALLSAVVTLGTLRPVRTRLTRLTIGILGVGDFTSLQMSERWSWVLDSYKKREAEPVQQRNDRQYMAERWEVQRKPRYKPYIGAQGIKDVRERGFKQRMGDYYFNDADPVP